MAHAPSVEMHKGASDLTRFSGRSLPSTGTGTGTGSSTFTSGSLAAVGSSSGSEPLESFDVPQLESRRVAAISTTTIPFRLRLRTIPPSNSCTRQSQLGRAYEIVGGPRARQDACCCQHFSRYQRFAILVAWSDSILRQLLQPQGQTRPGGGATLIAKTAEIACWSGANHEICLRGGWRKPRH